MTLLESVRRYLLACPLLGPGAFGVDYLGERPGQYSLDAVPGGPMLRRYHDGGARKQLLFTLRSREYYGEDARGNLKNAAFYERFAGWLQAQDRGRRLPDLGAGRRALKIEALTGGYVLRAGTGSACYQIQCRLVYYEKGDMDEA